MAYLVLVKRPVEKSVFQKTGIAKKHPIPPNMNLVIEQKNRITFEITRNTVLFISRAT